MVEASLTRPVKLGGLMAMNLAEPTLDDTSLASPTIEEPTPLKLRLRGSIVALPLNLKVTILTNKAADSRKACVATILPRVRIPLC